MIRVLIALLLAALPARGQEALEPDPLQARLESFCAALSERIETYLGPKFERPVPVKLVTPQFIADFALEMEAKLTPGETVEAATRLAERLRLVPAGFDLRAAQLELLKSQVAGLYDPDKDCFYVVRDRVGAVGSPAFLATAAHELIHAYRDVDKDFWKRVVETMHTDADQAIAITCLAEGDATLLGLGIGFAHVQNRDPGVFVKAQATIAENTAAGLRAAVASPMLEKIPYALREMMLGRYAIGLVLAAEIYEKGGVEALEKAYDNPPRSTEQVLHPKKYLGPGVDEPVVFAGGDPTSALGEGWRLSLASTSGEFDLRIQFRESLGKERAEIAAAGWDGIRFFFCEKEGTGGFLGLVSAWDSGKDAGEFAQAWLDWAAGRDGGDGKSRIVTTEEGMRLVETAEGRVAVLVDGARVLVADGVPAGREEAVFEALASATPVAAEPD